MSLHLIKRIKDRLKLAHELRKRGYEVPHPDSDAYDTSVAAVLMNQALYESLNDHFEPVVGDAGVSNDFSTSSGSDFSGGGGMSGGGGADGAW